MSLKKNLLAAICILTVIFCFHTALAAGAVLTLPENLQVIETEAFYGNTSIGSVVLKGNVTEIQARAFANSSLTDINLPDSIQTIADDAFDGVGPISVTANEGSTAYTWAVEHGYIIPAPVQNDPNGGLRSITVHWDASEGAQSYIVAYGTSDQYAEATEIAVTETGSYTIKSLQPGITYYTWVRAVGTKALSPVSNVKSMVTIPAVPELHTPTVTGNSVVLSWDETAGVDVYRVNYGKTDSYNSSVRINNITTTTCTISGLDYATEYFIWIGAANESGGVRATNPVSITTEQDPNAPVQKTSKGYVKSVIVNWEEVPEATSYIVCYATSNDISSAVEIPDVTGTTYTIENLLAGTTYYTWVKAVRANGTSGPSGEKHVITYPDAPTLNTPEVSGNTITLSWAPVTGATVYRLHYNTKDNFNTSTKIDNLRTTSYVIDSLDFNTTYYLWTSAANASGGLRTINSVQVTTGDDPLTPHLTEMKGGLRKVTVSWDAVEGADSYNVYYGTSGDISQATAVTGITDAGSHEIKNLVPGKTYYAWVKAVSAGTESYPSNRSSAMTYPGAATLKTPEVSGNSVTLKWDAVEGAIIYRIKYGTNSDYAEATELIDNIRDTTCTIDNLTDNTTYCFWIITANTSGGVRNINSVSATIGTDPNAE